MEYINNNEQQQQATQQENEVVQPVQQQYVQPVEQTQQVQPVQPVQQLQQSDDLQPMQPVEQTKAKQQFKPEISSEEVKQVNDEVIATTKAVLREQGEGFYKTTKESVLSDYESGIYELPFGIVDEEGVLHKTFTLKGMTGQTFEKIGDKNIKNNIAKIVTALLLDTVTSIGSIEGSKLNAKVINGLNTIDRDYIMLVIYYETYGSDLTFDGQCPHCNKQQEINVFVDRLMKDTYYLKTDSPRSIPLELIDGVKIFKDVYKKVFLRPMNGYAQIQLAEQGDKINRLTLSSLVAYYAIETIEGTSKSPTVAKNLTGKDIRHILRTLEREKLGTSHIIKVECFNCNNKFNTSIPTEVLLGEY